MRTTVPLGPLSRSATSAVLSPSVDLSSTFVITSPGRMPALYAGEPTKGARTTVRPSRGKYYGVGMTVAPREGRTVVLAPFVGTPAYEAAIRPGHVITNADDQPNAGTPNA